MEEGKFSYRRLTIPEGRAADVAAMLGYREDEGEWYVYRIPQLSVGHRKRFEDAGMQVYLPTYTVTQFIGGRKVTVEKPKMLNYLFALGRLEQVDRLRVLENLTPVYRHRCAGETLRYEDMWLTVPRSQMHSLMIVAQGYEQEMEFCTPEDQMLEKGDRVRVMDGKFRGVEGILVMNQGCRNGGKVYVSIDNGFGTKTMAIPDEYIQVLEFSRDTNHFSRKMEAVEQLLDRSREQRSRDGVLSEENRTALQFFLFRYRELGGLTHAAYARLTACRYAAQMLLGCRGEAEECLKKYQEETLKDKNSRRAARRSVMAQNYIAKWTDMGEA